MRPIGFSTGALARSDVQRALVMLKDHPAVSVVELSALREEELEPLVKMAKTRTLDLAQFAYVAVHAPSRMASEQRAVELMEIVNDFGWSIVVHPDAIQDWSLWRRFGQSLCIENMDNRKRLGRSRGELHSCFDRLPDASFCLDLGHARQFDPTMTEAFLILQDLGSRLKQVHLSDVTTDSTHCRISYCASLAFQEVAALLPEHLPIVLETPVGSDQMALELKRAEHALRLNSLVPRSRQIAANPAP